MEVEKPHGAAPAVGARCWCCVGQGDSTLGCLGPCRMTNSLVLRDSLAPGVKLGSFAMKLSIVFGERPKSHWSHHSDRVQLSPFLSQFGSAGTHCALEVPDISSTSHLPSHGFRRSILLP